MVSLCNIQGLRAIYIKYPTPALVLTQNQHVTQSRLFLDHDICQNTEM